MKTFTKYPWLLFLLPLFLLFSSCKKDQHVLNSLEGTWQILSVTHLKQNAEPLPTQGSLFFESCDQSGPSNACPGEYTFENQPPIAYQFSVLEKGKVINFASFTIQAYEKADKLYILQGPFNVVTRTDARLELEGTMTIGDKAAGPVLADVRLVLEK